MEQNISTTTLTSNDEFVIHCHSMQSNSKMVDQSAAQGLVVTLPYACGVSEVVHHILTSLGVRQQDAWLLRIRRQDLKPESYATIRVCSDHFVTGRPAKLYDTTHQDWAPLLILGYNAKMSDSEERCARVKKTCGRTRADVFVDVASGSSECDEGKEVQTAVTHSDITAL